jgi:O-antigen/teichoic acid export membrane protein
LTKIKDLLRGLKDLSAIGIVDIISTIIGGLFWFYIVTLLDAEQYGQISYLIAIAGLASSVALLGSENTLTIYTAKKIKLQSAVYLITIFAGTIASIVVFFITNRFEVGFLVFGYLIFNLVGAEMLGRMAYVPYARYILVNKLLMVGLSIGLFFVIGESGIIIGIALSSSLYGYSVYKVFKTIKIDFSLIKERTGFMITSYLTSLSNRFADTLDKIIIAPMLGFVILGNYQLGLQFLEVLSILPSIVFKYILPQDAQGNPNKKLKKLTIISSVFITIGTILLSPLTIPTIFPKYTESVQIIQILSISLIPSTINVIYVSKLLGSERNKIVLCGSLIFLTIQTISIILLGIVIGVSGAAIGFLLGVTCQTVFYLIMSRYQKF